jgi:hypothetical protein
MLLSFAIFRLGSVALELSGFSLTLWQWLIMLAWFTYMIWAEGYKGFHLAFAPRVVVRASYLANNPKPLHVLLAPLFCMGYIHATPRRRIMSLALSGMIVCFVLLARLLPQPWRGIVDVGVVAGLIVGVGSIVFYLLQLKQAGASSLPVPTDVPV